MREQSSKSIDNLNSAMSPQEQSQKPETDKTRDGQTLLKHVMVECVWAV